MGKFRWGIIGPGRIAHGFAAGLAGIEDARLYAVASTSRVRGDAFAGQYGAEKVYNRYADLVADPDVDAVYISTPHNFHYEQACLCLEAGKPLLCEKPLTVTAEQTRRLIALAERNRVFLMEAVWSRFLPAWQQVRKWIDQGRIGEVLLASSTFGFRAPRNEQDRLLNPALAGGALLDIGIYNISLSRFVMGCPPRSMQVDGYVGPTGVDERVSAILNYGGPVAQFTCSFMSQTANSFEISGNEGRIRVAAPFWGATRAELITPAGTELFDGAFRVNGYEYETEEAIRCIRACKLQSEVIPWQDTLNTMEVIEQMLAQLGIHHQHGG